MSATKSDYLATIAAEGARMVTAIRSDPEAVVPHYPSWTGRDLAVHTGAILSRTARVARELPQERVSGDELPAGMDAIDWLEQCFESMVSALSEVDSETTVWSFLPDQRIAAWERRMTIEVGVHRWDAEGAAGDAEPLPDVVAVSGLDEFPVMFLERLGELPTLELRATDLDRSWTYGRDAASLLASGTASDLYLRLMARPGAEVPDVWAAALDAVPSASG